MLTDAPLPPLDEAVRASRHLPGEWFLAGVAQVVIPVVVTITFALVLLTAPLPQDADTAQVYAITGALVSALFVRLSLGGLAEQHGSWRAAFGFSLPGVSDVPHVVGWLAVQLAARAALLTVLAAAVSPRYAIGFAEGGVPVMGSRATLLMLLGAVVVAPVMEEVAFRGVLLRGLMRRMTFWPSALASSAVFAALHLAGVTSVAAIPTVLFTVLAFGMLQCLLVRRTGNLGPAMAVHGTLNLVVTAFAVGAFSL
jgi:membrane protease YdiL (CAAX protease family)